MDIVNHFYENQFLFISDILHNLSHLNSLSLCLWHHTYSFQLQALVLCSSLHRLYSLSVPSFGLGQCESCVYKLEYDLSSEISPALAFPLLPIPPPGIHQRALTKPVHIELKPFICADFLSTSTN